MAQITKANSPVAYTVRTIHIVYLNSIKQKLQLLWLLQYAHKW
jgi:hypothetical protein